ncbi:MAG: FtsW/RodA/SpoVE family cell cycle protein [Clostridia bacterium]|nr:FtsW/RodA/SpoVE family cell cycle protein [Clostridia bacterium]
MKVFSTTLKERLRQLDFVIILCAAGMTAISVMTLYGVRDDYTAGSRMFVVQLGAAVLGFISMVIISLVDYDAFLTKLWIPMFFASIFLMALVFVLGVGASTDSDQKLYIDLGIVTWQVSETVKFTFILSFSKHADLVKKHINSPKNLLFLLLHAAIIVGLVILTGDLGSALVFICIFAAILFSAGLSLWYFAGAIAVCVVALPFVWPHLSEYQQMRILCGFDPTIDPDNYGYQALRSLDTIAAGGIFGQGINGGGEYLNLPVATTDFLFSVMCEKFGFLGALVYLILMGIMIFRIIRVAKRSRKDVGAFLCTGVLAVLIAQTTENMGMCLAVLPVIGITMPFMSYGGSSMLMTWVMLGLVQSVRLHNTKYYFEREDA